MTTGLRALGETPATEGSTEPGLTREHGQGRGWPRALRAVQAPEDGDGGKVRRPEPAQCTAWREDGRAGDRTARVERASALPQKCLTCSFPSPFFSLSSEIGLSGGTVSRSLQTFAWRDREQRLITNPSWVTCASRSLFPYLAMGITVPTTQGLPITDTQHTLLKTRKPLRDFTVSVFFNSTDRMILFHTHSPKYS